MKFSLGLAATLFLPVLVNAEIPPSNSAHINVSALLSAAPKLSPMLLLLRFKLPLVVNCCTTLRALLRKLAPP
jgi:hypothetical protein